MNRQNNVPFSPAAMHQGAAPVFKQLHVRVPQDFIEAMKRVPVKPVDKPITRTPDVAAKTAPVQKTTAKSVNKWKSSFKPVGDEDEDDCLDQSTSVAEKVELYDPYDPGSSDSELDTSQNKDRNTSPTNQDKNPGCQRLSPGRGSHEKSRWDSREPKNRSFDRSNFNPESRPSKNLSSCLKVSDQQTCKPDTESLDRPTYGSVSRPLDHRVRSPDTIVHITKQFPAYGGQQTNGEQRILVPDHRREVTSMTTTVRLSSPQLQRDYQHQMGFMETGLDQITPATEVKINRSKTLTTEKCPITCDLCEVELSNGQELEEHLDSRSHWATLEHIQQMNSYDDLAVAFLQEVMLYKSRQCSRAIEDSALQALQENDHMTKVEMFHCAACKIFVCTSASSVQAHITSQEHLSNTKEFEVRQRRTCLDKAETIMNELKPQFEHFVKGDTLFK